MGKGYHFWGHLEIPLTSPWFHPFVNGKGSELVFFHLPLPQGTTSQGTCVQLLHGILPNNGNKELTYILLMAEIRRLPVEVGSFSHYLQGFSTIPGGAGFQPSTV